MPPDEGEETQPAGPATAGGTARRIERPEYGESPAPIAGGAPRRNERAPDGGEHPLRRGAPRGAASASERAPGAGPASTGGVPRNEGPLPAQPDGTAGTGGGLGGSKGGGAPLGGPSKQGKQNKPKRKWRAAFFVLAGAGILAAVAWALLGSRFLVVRVITVSGTHLVSQAQVIAAADVPAGTPLIRVDPAQVAARVEKIRQVASAQVGKQWPDGLAITVRERVPVVAVKMSAGGYDLLDHDGVTVLYVQAKPAAMPVLQTAVPGSELPGNAGVATVAEVLTGLPGWLSRQVSSVEVSGPTVTLYLTGNQTVVWGGPDRSGVKASELAILMRDPARFYDVSSPETVVTR